MSINQNVQTRKLRWNNFNLSHTHDTTGRFGNLIPVQCMEVVPGDMLKEKIEFNIRLSPLSAPAMVRLNAHFHAFYCPYRLLTPRNGQESTWEKFIMNVGNPMTIDGELQFPELPYFYSSEPFLNDDEEVFHFAHYKYFSKGSLWDYFKLPIYDIRSQSDISLPYERRISALPHLFYLKCFNDWYRRDQIEEEVIFPLNLASLNISVFDNSDYVSPEDSVNSTWKDISFFSNELLTLRSRNYERDYFTSGLPEPQFGDDVTIGNMVDVYAAAGASLSLRDVDLNNSNITSSLTFTNNLTWRTPDESDPSTYNYYQLANIVFDQQDHLLKSLRFDGDREHKSPYFHLLNGDMTAEVTGISGLTSAPTFSINELRMAMQLQGLREQINRGGTRYIEIMKSVYGVSVSDLRLQRVQYLGGVKAPITIGSVIQTSESANTPQGTLTGQGGVVGGNVLFHNKHIFEEHGLIMVLMSITPRTSYYGGVPRMFRKFDPLDYYNPMFDHLGEQETKKTELYDSIIDRDAPFVSDEVFAYNPRYQDYKSAISTVTGEFRDTLSNWVLSRSFNQAPALSPDFIHADSEDFDRLFMFENVENTSNEHFQAQIYFDIKAKRPMSKYSTPFTFY